MFRKLYLSPFGYVISGVLHAIAWFHKPFMSYGYFNRHARMFQKYTRVSSSAKLIHKDEIDLGNHVWIGHYCLVDGTGGVSIGEGTQISSHTAIYSHSSQDAIRLLGRDFIKIKAVERPGYKLKPVKIGAYTFVGTSSVILPGTTIGKGCLIGAGSLVSGNIPDYAIAVGNPVEIIGDTRERDQKRFSDIADKEKYYDPDSIS